MNNPDEEVPYRSPFDLNEVTEDTGVTKDEEQHSTLIRVYKILKEGVTELDSWRAFKCPDTDLKIKQHIHSHEMAYDILAPALEEVRQALSTIDERFKQRNTK